MLAAGEEIYESGVGGDGRRRGGTTEKREGEEVRVRK